MQYVGDGVQRGNGLGKGTKGNVSHIKINNVLNKSVLNSLYEQYMTPARHGVWVDTMTKEEY